MYTHLKRGSPSLLEDWSPLKPFLMLGLMRQEDCHLPTRGGFFWLTVLVSDNLSLLSVANPCMNMTTDKDSASSSKYALEPHSPALFSDCRKHRNQSKIRNDCMEMLPGLFESTSFDRYLVLSLGDDLRVQDTDIFDMHRDIVKSIGREPKISLLIEAISPQESEKIRKLNKIQGYKVDCKRHQSMNSCRGVIFSKQLIKYSEEKLLQEFKGQYVMDVKRIKKKSK